MSSPKSKKKPKGPPTPEEIAEEEKRSKLAMKAAMRTRMRKVTGEKVGAVYEAFAFTSESEAVDLTNKGLGEGAGMSFGSVLIHQGLGSEDGPASGLEALTVKTNLLGPAGCASLCKALDPLYLNTRLAKLDLQENSIGVAGAKSIAAMLAINGTVHTLHLGSNKMGPDGAKAIADALPNNAALTWLSLRANDVANQGCPPLSAAHFGILEHLDLRDNNIGNTGMDKLAAGFAKNHSLTDLDLRGNTFGKEGLYAVGNAILRKRVVFLKKEKEKKKFDPETYVKREYTYAIYFHGVEIAAQSTFSKVCAVS